MLIHRPLFVCLSLLSFIVTLTTASAVAAGEGADKTLSPYFYVRSDDPRLDRLPLKSSAAAVTVSGIIADVELKQIYENEGERTLEAVYVFPASTRAAVHAMKMTIGKRVIEAKIKERDKARKTYEKARAEGRTASLLEQQRANVFQMSVANIRPGDRVEVALSYTELIVPREREYEFVLPTVVGPRYSNTPAATAPKSERWVANPHLHAGAEPPFDFEATVHLKSGIPISKVSCPSHAVDVTFDGRKEARIALRDSAAANRDFVVRYELLGQQIETGLLTYENAKERFFLMMMEPPKRMAPDQTVPREHLFIVDISGSMNGFPLDVSKTLMKAILDDLTPRDAFNVMLFAGGSDVLSDRSLTATEANVEAAKQWIDAAGSGGGTELLPALERALALPRREGASRIVTVITDGYVTVEREAYELVKKSLGEANLFAFGIGSSVNRELIEVLARAGTGEPFVVEDQAAAAAAARRFQRYVSSPVLQGISVSFDGFDAYDVEPRAVADLFSHRPVVVFGKYRGKPKGRIVVEGHSSRGDFVRRISAADAVPAAQNRPLRHLWARNRIRALTDLEMLTQGRDQQRRITRLGLRYSLMTAYTSFVAADTVIRKNGKAVRVRQPVAMPAGVPDTAVGHDPMNALGALMGQQIGGNFGYGGRAAGGVSAGSGYGRGGLGARRTPAPKIRSGAAVVKGTLGREVVRRIVQRHSNETRACYSQALRADPHLKGRVVVRFVISSTGTVLNAAITQSTLEDAAFEACLLAAIQRWTFPKPQEGVTVVTYPFTFSPR